MKKKFLTNFLRVAISAGLITFLIWKMRGNLGEVFSRIASADLRLLGLATLISILNACFMGFRLKQILQVQKIRLSLKETSALTFMGYFFNNFLPTSIGGDVVKAYYAWQKSKKAIESYTSVFLDRLIGMSTMGLIALIPLVAGRSIKIDKIAFVAVAALIGGSIFIYLVIWNRTIALKFRFLGKLTRFLGLHAKIKQAYECLHTYIKHKKVLAGALICSIMMQAIFISTIYLLARSIHVDAPMMNFFLFVPIVGAVSMLPSLGGLGVRESAFVYFFASVMSKEQAFAVSMLWLFQLFILSLIGGLLHLFKFHVKIKEEELKQF